MSGATVYALAGVLLFCLGAYAVLVQAHLLRRILALNVMASGTFLAFVALAQRAGAVDPVPHALVLTGIVIAFSSTAFALALARRLYDTNGATTLEEDKAP
jgi:multicomponent Na+:H+ antiporter subunit C